MLPDHPLTRYDLHCVAKDWTWAACTGCWLPNTLSTYVSVTLRGLCPRSKFDSSFEVSNDARGYVSYRGKTNTVVSYQPADRKWRMTLVNIPEVWAISNASIESLLMGRHLWTVYNDLDCGGEEAQLMLSFTTCKEDQFTCDNGLCINILDRCNSRPDCLDLSDEFECRKIDPGPSYQAYIAPPPINSTGKIIVDVSADIMSILDIDEISSIFQVQFFLHLTWYDSRLRFYNLKEDTGLNALSPEEKTKLWAPHLTYVNTENKPITLVDEKTSITIKKQGSFKLSKIEDVENQQFFEGADNSMTMSRFYNIRFICNYQMQWYPFDVQKCKLILAMQGKTSDFTQLHNQVLQFLGNEEVNQYVVLDTSMLVSDKAELEIEIVLGRRLLTIILTTIVPTVLLNIISYATNHFKAFFFEAIVSVNLTAMLVQTTLFIEVTKIHTLFQCFFLR